MAKLVSCISVPYLPTPLCAVFHTRLRRAIEQGAAEFELEHTVMVWRGTSRVCSQNLYGEWRRSVEKLEVSAQA